MYTEDLFYVMVKKAISFPFLLKKETGKQTGRYYEKSTKLSMEGNVPGDLLLSGTLGQKTMEGRSGQDAGKRHSYYPNRGVCLE